MSFYSEDPTGTCHFLTDKKYRKIYENTYWGRNPIGYGYEDQFVIDNRNKFIGEFNIKKYVSSRPTYIYNFMDDIRKIEKLGSHIDHIEYYYTNDGNYVIIVSPYCDNPEKFAKYGWTKYYNLYSKNSHTYYKILNKNQRN